MRMKFRASEIADLVGGDLIGADVDVDGASIDSRSIVEGNLFVPIVAERDGHEFIDTAVAAGAPAYLSDRPPSLGTAIVVADTGEALSLLGMAARNCLTGPVVGVTGSVGKTSVKDLIAAALGGVRRVHANIASFNNELGLPLTLVNAPVDTQIAVLEMGARGRGHVAELCAIGRPTIGVVTRVAGAHTELFGSLEAVAEAKGELVEALPPEGTAVLNADDPLVRGMSTRTAARVLTFGATGDVRVADLTLDALLRPHFTLVTPDGRAQVQLPLAGAHMALNAAAAAAVGIACGVDLADLVNGLETATISDWRMDVSTTHDGTIVINDAYNANPTSVRAALAALGELVAEHKTAVLGVMAELGDEHEDEHRAIAAEATAAGIRVIAVGAAEYGPDVEHVDGVDDALATLGAVGEGHAVLVKGSRVAGLERLAQALTGRGDRGPRD